MSYNKQYNTRNSGRYNTPGQFVPAAEPPQSEPQMFGQQPTRTQMQNKSMNQNQNQNLQMIQTMSNIELKSESEQMDTTATDATGEEGSARPYWMKSKLAGVRKLSNRERRRRQNENLRRLLTPKNALMVLNEMMPNEQLATQFKVNQAANSFNSGFYYSKHAQHSFCADLTLDGNTYKGYGDNKLTARNAAAEQAIRDLIIKKMTKVLNADASGSQTEEAGAGAGAGGEAEAEGNGSTEDEALPMIQLASFALHKLFAEWEYEGHKVPQLKPNPNSVSESAMETGGGGGAGAGSTAPKSKPEKKPKELPPNAATMHPSMLLTYMRPQLEYRELAVTGDRPQNILFTLGVEVDGATYIGKAANKKEARRLAARAACTALFGVQFQDAPAQ